MHPLANPADLTPLIKEMTGKKVVMLGEATHGTHEFYTWRTAISKQLVQEQGFNFIAVEGDWPDCYRVNRYVKGYADAGSNIADILHAFDRWPTWMWANWEVAALAEWLREYNRLLPPEKKVGFYGLDVYSLWDSMQAVIQFLEKEDPQTARSVRKAIQCFEPFQEKEHLYAQHSLTNHSCRQAVLSLLQEIRKRVPSMEGDREAGFDTEQNALIAVNAEKYYSSMIGFDDNSWNVRDTHMMETLDRLLGFYGHEAKGIVWEHNTHIGDARATDMQAAGMHNLGQLARQQYGSNNVYLCGFATYQGTVVAGTEWGAPMQVMEVPPAREGSIEHILHEESPENRYLLFAEEDDQLYRHRVRHRAIGVVYSPMREQYGNYVPSVLAKRYDALIYLDKTQALHALHMAPHNAKTPETFPFGV